MTRCATHASTSCHEKVMPSSPTKNFKAWALTQHKAKIQILWSNCGGEYLSGRFNNHLALSRMEQRLTCHDTPHKNSIAECLNHTLLERVCAMLQCRPIPWWTLGRGAPTCGMAEEQVFNQGTL